MQNGEGYWKNKKALAKLKRETNAAKHILSELESVAVSVEDLTNGSKFLETLMHAHFESLCAKLCNKTFPLLATVLKDSGLQKSEINDIILIGGPTRVPKIRHWSGISSGKNHRRTLTRMRRLRAALLLQQHFFRVKNES
jgi:heat shock protein 5